MCSSPMSPIPGFRRSASGFGQHDSASLEQGIVSRLRALESGNAPQFSISTTNGQDPASTREHLVRHKRTLDNIQACDSRLADRLSNLESSTHPTEFEALKKNTTDLKSTVDKLMDRLASTETKNEVLGRLVNNLINYGHENKKKTTSLEAGVEQSRVGAKKTDGQLREVRRIMDNTTQQQSEVNSNILDIQKQFKKFKQFQLSEKVSHDKLKAQLKDTKELKKEIIENFKGAFKDNVKNEVKTELKAEMKAELVKEFRREIDMVQSQHYRLQDELSEAYDRAERAMTEARRVTNELEIRFGTVPPEVQSIPDEAGLIIDMKLYTKKRLTKMISKTELRLKDMICDMKQDIARLEKLADQGTKNLEDMCSQHTETITSVKQTLEDNMRFTTQEIARLDDFHKETSAENRDGPSAAANLSAHSNHATECIIDAIRNFIEMQKLRIGDLEIPALKNIKDQSTARRIGLPLTAPTLPSSPQPSDDGTSCSAQTPDKSVSVYTDKYVEWLQKLDFRPAMGMTKFKDVDVRVDEHLIFSDGPDRYYLKRNSIFSFTPLVMARDRRGCQDEDFYAYIHQPYHKRAYKDTAMEIMYSSDLPVDDVRSLPKYVVYLGEVYCATEGERTGQLNWRTDYHLVMDIARPAKSLWLVFGYECKDANGNIRNTEFEVEENDFWSFVKENESFDIAKVAENVNDWNICSDTYRYDQPELHIGRVREAVSQSARIAKPLFTSPNLEALLSGIRKGWRGWRDATTVSSKSTYSLDETSNSELELDIIPRG
ncbi:uncharacterized protein JN550_012040 [Neoarthrinium moseri]|uniref:uncharacterized protein n=1 Tax=Neoarthrinium moseri TaxID=1658444 RepID=UPI001FDBF902|nr:uncharacterized protein JN550_012040 [Neoarthrinium moseri]KAI1859522.1 hypothetical protein JN550_012040 [Neoarthrinium moseri]